MVLSDRGRDRVFNLGHYTWVEQQGVPLDDMINELNDEVVATFV